MMRSPFRVLCVLSCSAAVLMTGCESDLQSQLDQKRAERYAEATAALKAVESKRIKELTDRLPAKDAKPEGRRHALLLWRSGLFETKAKAKEGEELEAGTPRMVPVRDDEATLKKLESDYAGTPAAKAARFGAAYAVASHDFWTGKANLEGYYRFLNGYTIGAAREAQIAADGGDSEYVGWPFLAEAEFDKIFLHASRYYLTTQLPDNARLLASYPMWQLAFNQPSRARERFGDYVTRLCRASDLAKRCKGVPHELRPRAINKPYLEIQEAMIKGYVSGKQPEVLITVAKRYGAAVGDLLQATPDFTEDPVLPATFSDRAASTGLMLRMSRKTGVKLHQEEISASYSGSVPGALKAKAVTVIQTLRDTPGNQVDFERVVLEMPGDVSSKQVARTIQSFSRDIVRQVDLVGRRRADESLRRTGLLVRLQGADEQDNLAYWLHAKKRKKHLRENCEYLGYAGKPPIGRTEPGSQLWITKKRIKGTLLSRDPDTRVMIPGEVTLDVAPSDTAALAKWAAANEGNVRFFISMDHTYEQFMEVATRLLYSCIDLEVAVDEQGREKMTVTCGKSEDRDITLVLGFCAP